MLQFTYTKAIMNHDHTTVVVMADEGKYVQTSLHALIMCKVILQEICKEVDK